VASPGNESLRGVAKWLVASVLVTTTLFAILMAFGIALQVAMLADKIHSPSPNDAKPVAYVAGIVVSTALCAFLMMVSKRLHRTLRGEEPRHLIPPWLAIPLAAALGAGAIVAAVTFPSYAAGRAAGTGIGFLIYAGVMTYRWVRQSRITN
jgi:hypothetical protein